MSRRGKIRIIAGDWRRRLLPIPDAPGLRPTPDRVRETLFNWLANSILGARCLDLYAGSGALGFEAASRGAASVTLVERDRGVADHLRRQAQRLAAEQRIEVVNADAWRWLEADRGSYDLVFLDPPFGRDDPVELCRTLADRGVVASGGLVYLEASASEPDPVLPNSWRIARSQRAGRVRYHLLAYDPDTHSTEGSSTT